MFNTTPASQVIVCCDVNMSVSAKPHRNVYIYATQENTFLSRKYLPLMIKHLYNKKKNKRSYTSANVLRLIFCYLQDHKIENCCTRIAYN